MKVHLGRLLEGPAGVAREVIVDEFDTVDQSATLACWFLTCPGQSPAWENYLLSCVHLRPVEGAEHDAVINVPGATHELMVLAMNPDFHPVAEDPETWGFLRPTNVIEQFEVPSDNDAIRLTGQTVRAVLDGIFWAEPPLAGQVEPWRSSIIRTSAHYRGEPHAP